MEDGPWMQALRLRVRRARGTSSAERIAEKPWTPSQEAAHPRQPHRLDPQSRHRDDARARRAASKTLVEPPVHRVLRSRHRGAGGRARLRADSTGFLPNVSHRLGAEKPSWRPTSASARVVVRVGLYLSNGGAFLGALWPWRLDWARRSATASKAWAGFASTSIVRAGLFARSIRRSAAR